MVGDVWGRSALSWTRVEMRSSLRKGGRAWQYGGLSDAWHARGFEVPLPLD